jgi:hypothetical protein
VGSNPTPRTIVEHPAIDEILTKYLNYLLCKKALKPATIKLKVKTIKSLLKHGIELPNPDNVIAFICLGAAITFPQNQKMTQKDR